MGARKTLNAFHVTGALAMAVLFGSITQSWLVFMASAAVLVGMRIHSGAIRIQPKGDRRK